MVEASIGTDRTAAPAQAVLARRERIGVRILALSAIALLAATIGSITIGPTGISLPDAVTIYDAARSGHWTDGAKRAYLVLVDLRLPRTLIGAFVGAALAVSGAMLQGLFRNPLADPGIVGVSAGGALAAIAAIALGDGILRLWHELFGIYAIPLAAFCGSLAATFLLVAIAERQGRLMVGTLLLAGIAVGAFAAALSGLIAYASDDRELRDLTLWTMGSLSGATWAKVAGIAPFSIALVIALPMIVRALNGLLLGEMEAFNLGVNVQRFKLAIVALSAAAAGASVAVAGLVGFVGIVIPHFIRLIAGPDHRVLLPASAMAGGAILLLADILARIVVSPAELPIGIIMALIGAPVFLHLVLNRRATGI